MTEDPRLSRPSRWPLNPTAAITCGETQLNTQLKTTTLTCGPAGPSDASPMRT
jgi:hypothetical protein